MALVNCRECGKQISDQAAACPHCGAPLTNRPQPTATPVIIIAPKSRSAAVLFAMLLGGLGIHKFYLNSPGWGVIYLLFAGRLFPQSSDSSRDLVTFLCLTKSSGRNMTESRSNKSAATDRYFVALPGYQSAGRIESEYNYLNDPDLGSIHRGHLTKVNEK